jgi:transcriptional regulator with XRE-family HTH domain
MAMNLTQTDVAFLMDLKPTQISKWELGKKLPGITNAIGLAVATDRLVEDVFFDIRKEWQAKVLVRRELLNSVGRK